MPRISPPLSATIELTLRCNWRCAFCYNARHSDRDSLSAAEWAVVFDDLRAMGALHLTFTGGEPMVRPDFFEIARAARKRHFALTIFTNGSLIDAERAAEIRSLSPYVVEMSLHGATPAVHDLATGRPGSFHSLLAAIGHLQAQQVRIHVKTVLTTLNEIELDEMIDLARRLAVNFSIDPEVKPRDDGAPDPLRFRASVAARRRAYEYAKSIGQLPSVSQKPGEPNCGLGGYTLGLDAEGNVYACPRWRMHPLGNVRQVRLADLWSTSPQRAEAAAVANRVPSEIGKIANITIPFCPALALAQTGDPFTPSDSFLENARLIDSLR